jgi:hypothetical protein
MADGAPCASCPWRIGSTSVRIPGFDEDKATCSLPSVADPGEDGFRPVMACHLSTLDGNDRPCIGYVLSDDGYANLAVRLAVVTGDFDLAAMQAGADGLDLYSTFDEMMAALVPGYGDPR